jgi:hypothetical protein
VNLKSIGYKLVEMCNQGKNFDLMRTMYTPDIVSVEGDGSETVGEGPVIHKSEVWQANNTVHSQKVRGPFFNGPDQFAAHFTTDMTRKRTNERISFEEIGVYTVKGDKIAREQFFYGGEH